ncbi:MAG: Hsp20/alpha crystallin family protein [bacterium]
MNLVKVKNPQKLYLEDYMQDFREEMNNMLKSAFHNSDFGLIEDESGKERKIALWKPAVELTEHEGNYIVKAEIPGVNKEDIDVEVSENNIEIKAEVKEKFEEKGENIYRSEFRYGKFIRHLSLPSEVDNTKAKAEYKDGILVITIPKSQEEQKKIKKIKPD